MAIAPHAGYVYSGPVAGHTFRAIRDGAREEGPPATVVVLGFTHRGGYAGVALMDGDAIEMECEGLGRLQFNVRDDLKRTWARTTRLQHQQQGGEGRVTPQLTGKYAKSA